MNSWTSMLLMPRPVQPAFRAKRPARSTILNAVIAVVAVLMFGATFRAGNDRGMDQMVSSEPYGRILNAISAVMTEQRFRQGGTPFRTASMMNLNVAA